MDRGSFLRRGQPHLSAPATCEPRPETANEPFEEKRRDGVPGRGDPKSREPGMREGLREGWRGWRVVGEDGKARRNHREAGRPQTILERDLV